MFSIFQNFHLPPFSVNCTIYKLACLTYNSFTTGHPGYLCSVINYYTPVALYDQLTNFFLIVHGSPLNLAKDPSATLHPQSAMICLLIQDSPPPSIPLSAVSGQSSLHSLPVLPPSDCRRLRFSVTADFYAPYKVLYYYYYYYYYYYTLVKTRVGKKLRKVERGLKWKTSPGGPQRENRRAAIRR